MSTVSQSILQRNLTAVEHRLAAACRRAGRSRSEVTLVAVTKSVSPAIAGLLPALGIRDLAENRPQELTRKAAAMHEPVRWHFIGHLQRNKIGLVLPIAELIHSVDSSRLLQAIDSEAGKLGKTIPVFLEANVSGEASKQGFAPAQLVELTPVIYSLRHVAVRGLMTMAPLQDAQACRPMFARLRELRDRWRRELASPHELDHLSMGMSNDFEVAVEEGATNVRLGTILFEGLPEDAQ